jgi:hypothetical protein
MHTLMLFYVVTYQGRTPLCAVRKLWWLLEGDIRLHCVKRGPAAGGKLACYVA